MKEPIVTVKQGKLKGAVNKLLDGTDYYSFKGIPYADAPQRFMAPQPPKFWQGTYEALEHGPVCPQFDMTLGQIIEGDENCLYLNVYTKSLQTDSKIPVMVFIHGGGYMSGSGDTTLLGPEFLLQQDIILVTINYRLEMFGFLCLDIPEAPGNIGMKDQVAALRWVQNNIEQFGGDPGNVTLFGESAGGASVLYHMCSPMSKGLFHKAIAQSGVPISDWAQGKDGKERAFRAAKFLGKDTTDTKELYQFLLSQPADKFPKITFKCMSPDEKFRGLPLHFAPVVEKKFENVEAFLTETTIDMILEKRLNAVPLIVGYNSVEGMMLVADALKKIDINNSKPHFLVPREIFKRVGEDKANEIGRKIINFYTNRKELTKNDAINIVNYLSDLHFVYNNHRFAHFYHAMCKSLYMYRFSCDTDINIMKKLTGTSHIKGTCHAEDLFYLFCSSLNKDYYEEQPKLREIIYRITKLWADFAKTGNPTPDNSLGVTWKPYSPATKDYLDINEELTPGQNAERARVDFWNKLYCEAGLPCITDSHL